MKRALLPLGIAAAIVVGVLVALTSSGSGGHEFDPPTYFPVLDAAEIGSSTGPADATETATFGSGCFWCTEAVFQRVKGVRAVASGFSGGAVANPTYVQVCEGTTGHAEVVQVTFDPMVVSYPELLEVFWRSHDPTQRNRQGNDYGPQYRSVIFYHSDQQRELADKYKKKINEAAVFADPVVTEIEQYTAFYPACKDHQDYYNRNSRTPYCRAIIGRKLDKLRTVFGERLKD
jgi:peptide-methionine (S)-S-oxide reductase